MTEDAKKLQRTARFLVVEAKQGHGSPPSYDTKWQPVWAAKVDRIEINREATPSVAVIWFPNLRWNQSCGLMPSDMVRIRTNEPLLYPRLPAKYYPQGPKRTILFEGFITRFRSSFSGGSNLGGSHERCAVICLAYRWLLSVTSPIFGQYARGPDDYLLYGTDEQEAKDFFSTFLSGWRAIFNPNGRPNRDPVPLVLPGKEPFGVPIFANPDPGTSEAWTARDMVRYILSPLLNKADQYFPIGDPNELPGLDHDDWDKVLNHIVVDGLNIIEALQLICRNIGWAFREDYEIEKDDDGVVTGITKPRLVLYKVASASAHSRDDTFLCSDCGKIYKKEPERCGECEGESFEQLSHQTILHSLHAPAVGDSIAPAVAEGKKLLWSMDLDEDITNVVNTPWGLGAPHRFEFTAELVPAWNDYNLLPDTSGENNANLFSPRPSFRR